MRNTNFFDKAVAQIVSDAGNYYVVGFRPGALDGKFHKIAVKVKRPGLDVRADGGYVAVSGRNIIGPRIPGKPSGSVM